MAEATEGRTSAGRTGFSGGTGEDDPDAALAELDRRIDEGTSPSEDLLREYERGGVARLLEIARL